jgi:hypothetical protein
VDSGQQIVECRAQSAERRATCSDVDDIDAYIYKGVYMYIAGGAVRSAQAGRRAWESLLSGSGSGSGS